MSHCTSLEGVPLKTWRCFYADEIRMVAALEKGPLVDALALVAREAFLGAAPWRLSSAAPSKDGAYRTTWEVRDLYHDVFVALKAEKRLNNGQPSLIVRAIAELQLTRADRVLHVGCGSGYYTALMAEVVGPDGQVTAVEIDVELADHAALNLSRYQQVKVVPGDGASLPLGENAYDAIFVNAAVTRPARCWLTGLSEGGTLVLPLSIGETAASNKALVVVVRRRGCRFAASLCSIFNIYANVSLRDEGEQCKLRACVESKAIGRLQSLRLDQHEEGSTCLIHSEEFCWSAEVAE